MYWLSYCLTTGTWLCPQVVPVQRWRKRDLCQWPWHCSREGDGNYEVITLITGFDPLSFYRQLLSQRNSSNIKIYQFQRFKEQRDTLYICKAKNISIVNKSFFILPPPHALSLPFFVPYTRIYWMLSCGWFSIFSVLWTVSETWTKRPRQTHPPNWKRSTKTQSRKRTQSQYNCLVIHVTDCVIFFKTFSSLFNHVFSFKLGLNLLRIHWQLVISRQHFWFIW